ncbi:MAG TPA: HRDC domain-containing protein [Microlunatus sp.]
MTSAEDDPASDDDVRVLNEPSEGLGEPITDLPGLRTAIDALGRGTGPVAIDAERAHGFRYSQRAYLIQLRRHDAGTFLIDPVALAPATTSEPSAERGDASGGRSRQSRSRPLADLSDLAEAIEDAEWDIHAATQDLPCLAEINLVPRRLFDTELAGRLLGYPRVNLGTLIEEVFSIRLLKEHSAADWSTRPLPREWLNYAALDVELLVELRDALAEELLRTGKDEWARQEFAWLAAGAGRPAEVRPDPWRRTSGIHKVRTRRGLAIVAELWRSRDQIARRTDNAPGRVLPDSAITEVAAIRDATPSSLKDVAGFNRRGAARYRANWTAALERALALSDRELPSLHRHASGPPQQARLWAAKDPIAAARLHRVRDALAEKAEELNLPVENLLTPDYLRRLAWRPPSEIDEHAVNDLLGGFGARPWQREIVVPLITPLLPEQ